MTNDPGSANTPNLTPHKAMKAAEKRRNAARHGLRENDPATFEAYRQAADAYDAAYRKWAETLHPNVKQLFDQRLEKGAPPKRVV
jgi:hypothetical protein